ncbi:MAG: hypothetical protein LLF76_12270 [Planctomycetaceae bacterium]|nr:hypothetical protein [Planctomycetaceae bacterium]
MDAPIVWNDLVLAYDIKNDVWFRLNGALRPGGVFNNAGLSVIGNRIFVAGAEGPVTNGTKRDRFNYFLTGRIKLK